MTTLEYVHSSKPLNRKWFVRFSIPQAMPHEIAQYLYKDSELQQLIERLRKSVDYCDELLKNWTKEFTRRLREADPAIRWDGRYKGDITFVYKVVLSLIINSFD